MQQIGELGQRATSGRVGRLRWWQGAALCAVMLVPMGCARELTITQDKYINTAMHMGRPEASRTGEPLVLTIVCIYPDDLKNDANDRLKPNSGITSDIWYKDRPLPGDKADMDDRGTRFWLPKSQIQVMTYDHDVYGKVIGDPLRGAATDKKEKVKRTFHFDGPVHADGSVIYIFPKFIDQNGRVLPVPPARFHPPGAYTEDLFVKIGVDESRSNYGQYIDNVTERKMHGKEKED